MGRIYAFAITLAVIAFGNAASASPCDTATNGLLVLKYEVGVSQITEEQKRQVDAFAAIAKYRNGVCILAQVDNQGSDEANRRVAAARAETVRAYLAAHGVREDAMEVQTQTKAMSLFGLIDDDNQEDRRVSLTYQ